MKNYILYSAIMVLSCFGQNVTNHDYYLSSGKEFMQMSVQVFGAVHHPGMFSVSAETDLISLLAIAGGAEIEADLSKVKIIHRNVDLGKNVQIVNINNFFENGTGDSPILRPGDIVIVDNKNRKRWKNILPVVSMFLQIINMVVLISSR